MLNFGNKEFRNLQEQVLYLSNRSNFGLNIKGEVETVPQLGDIPNTNIGDVYLVGKAAPFNFYIKTADKTWTNLGKLESNVPGPQGLQGIQGIKGADGSVIYTNNQPESANNGDLYISNDGKLYQYDNEWKLVTSLRGSVGPVGPKGPQGKQGLQGERGERGEKGDTGIGIRIGGNVATEDLLPSKPVGDTNAYLVGHGSPYELYVWNGTGWLNSGEFGTLDNIQVITIKEPDTATSGQLDAGQLNLVLESTSALIKHGNLIYRKEAVISTKAIYRCITDDFLYVISVNTDTGSWVKTTHILSQYWDVTDIPNGGIVTNYLADGSVTMPKLGNDVTKSITEIKNKGIINAIDIKTNQNFSLFNSDRLNILETQINADKNTIEYTSDKPLEITCNGANIIDCNAHFKKVEGQTRRYSPNIVELSNKDTTTSQGYTYSVNNGVISIKATGATQYTGIDFGDIQLSKGDTYTLYCDNVPDDYVLRVSYENSSGMQYKATSSSDKTVSFNFDGLSNFVQLRFQAETTNPKDFKQVELKPMLVKGTFSNETIPPFQPYDNTLVNSKATFVSTGRNLYSGVGNDGHVGFDIYSGSLPKGTYYLLFKAKTTNQPYDIRVYYGGDNFVTLSPSSTTETNVYTIPVKKGATRIYFNSWNKDYQMSDIMLVVDRNNTYEPYIKNISQYDIELGAYDYIENGNLVKQTSEMITLNGSENWEINNTIKGNRFVCWQKAPQAMGDRANNVVSNSSLEPVSADVSYVGEKDNTLAVSQNDVFIRKNEFTTVEQLKGWLQANPITLVYQKATPTITPIVVPNGIVSYKNGLTSQEIKGKYLPYKYTAKYVNGGQQ